MEPPRVERIKGGWAAYGNGWAVHGQTKQEAVNRFIEAERQHAEIDQRPPPTFETAR